MVVTIKQKTELVEEIQVELPAYYKTYCHQFKVISEDHCICVTEGGGKNVSIQKTYVELPFNIDAITSTEAEFNNAFMKVMLELKNSIK
jgi:hypothetical protein